MDEIIEELGQELILKGKELLNSKPKSSKLSDIDYLKFHLHIGMIKAALIIKVLQEVDKL